MFYWFLVVFIFFIEKDYGVSNVDLSDHKKKQLPPALLRPVPPSKRRLSMLRVTPIDMDRLSAFRAAVIIQKVVRGRGIQKRVTFDTTHLNGW